MDASQIRFDNLLTKVSVGYKNAEFIAPLVFPDVTVEEQSAKYLIAGKHNLRPIDDFRAPGAVANEIEWVLSNDTYFCDGHALKAVIPDEWRKKNLNLDSATTEDLTERIMLIREFNLVALLAAAMAPVDLTATPWDNDANDPMARIEQEKETISKRIGRRPNVLVLSRPVLRAIRNNAKVTGRITGASELRNSSVTAQQLADALELDEVIIGEATKLTSNEGAVNALDFVWGKYALLFYRPRTPGEGVISLGYTFIWNVGVNGRAVKKYRIEERTGDAIEAQKYYDAKIVDVAAGTLFEKTIA